MAERGKTRNRHSRPERPGNPGRMQGGSSELVDMAEAVAMLKTSQPTFYRWVKTGRIKGVKVGRQWRFHRDEIERVLRGEAPRIDLPADIRPLLAALRGRIDEAGGADIAPAEAGDLDRAFYLLVGLSLALRADGIHVSAQLVDGAEGVTATVRCRIDGVLHEMARFDARLLPAIVEHWKGRAGCNVRQTGVPQDGRIIMAIPAAAGGDRRVDIWVAFVPAAAGEGFTARVLDVSTVNLDLSRIDYSPRDRERILRAMRSHARAFIITGPAGSGKTTTAYACLNEIAGPSLKTMTIEDPVEVLLPWMTQTAHNPQAGLTFARAIRSFLRSDADAIYVGEIRDGEVANLIVQSALTGHFVMSTLHADDAAGALRRMVDVGVEAFVVADAVGMAMSQRLVRRLCPDCAEPAEPSAEDLAWAERAARSGGLDWPALAKTWKRAAGCPSCARTGYKGRTVVAETLLMAPEVAEALKSGASVDDVRAAAVRAGMTTMAADGICRAAAGVTTLDEVRRVLGPAAGA